MGWNGFTKLFSPGDGHKYGALLNGDLMYCGHISWRGGSAVWDTCARASSHKPWHKPNAP